MNLNNIDLSIYLDTTWCFFFFEITAGFGRNHWLDDKECQWVGFQHQEWELCLHGWLCCGGLQCGFGHSVPSHGVSSNAKAFELCCCLAGWAFHCCWRGIHYEKSRWICCYFYKGAPGRHTGSIFALCPILKCPNNGKMLTGLNFTKVWILTVWELAG